MIRIMAINEQFEIIPAPSLRDLKELPNLLWYWVDFSEPTEEEAAHLESHFHFHPLAIEDCFHLLQRPKVDHYEDVHFFVLHAMNPATLAAEEVDMFWGRNFIVTFHLFPSGEIDEAWKRMTDSRDYRGIGHVYAAYLVMDTLVDEYFPSVYQIEDQLNDFDSNVKGDSIQELMNEMFEIRTRLLKLRKTIVPMRDLFYRIISTDKIEGIKQQMFYFTDIHDHLLKLSEIIESNREMTADIRDSYISLNSYRMNNIMKTLTVITTIFMPLTFLAGIYGMNFHFMPELEWRWSYFVCLLVMFLIGFGMYRWFRKNGWFD
ncbi:magnesium/cobalt transporter CorA [Paenibacillus piri]|uniref:Magnesium transport protein CorA n=1 Tax=Paenibacillus piri TaxID=2547395 RepID=A0A4R5KVT7_9BACL|nr:magnesium/cobalt transporter CorA [Paenibacillus piri]TDF99278.1 magnesium/cobalt transporter CorA [Paenibacillus piri]